MPRTGTGTAIPVMCLLVAYVLAASVGALPDAHIHNRRLHADGAPAGEGSAAPSPSQPPSKPAFSCPLDANFTSSQEGYGKVDATADQATVNLQIQSTNSSAAITRNETARAAIAVQAALAKVIPINQNQIKTTGVSVQPLINSTNGNNTITGYQYTLNLAVQVDNATGDRLARVLDSAVAAGGDLLQIQGVSFDLSDAARAAATQQARKQAIDNAQSSAAFFAKSLGLRQGPVVGFAESSSNPIPPQPFFETARTEDAFSGKSLPAIAGGVTVTSQVRVTHEYCNQ